jgi:hypothetical protein
MPVRRSSVAADIDGRIGLNNSARPWLQKMEET